MSRYTVKINRENYQVDTALWEYCQAGQSMSSAALFKKQFQGSDEWEIISLPDLSENQKSH